MRKRYPFDRALAIGFAASSATHVLVYLWWLPYRHEAFNLLGNRQIFLIFDYYQWNLGFAILWWCLFLVVMILSIRGIYYAFKQGTDVGTLALLAGLVLIGMCCWSFVDYVVRFGGVSDEYGR